jgi:acetyl-CoA C-acetyltransferase
VNISKIPTLKPSFKKDGVVTAANASTLNDGASAVLLMSRAKAAALGLKPLAVIMSYADAEQAPIDFSTAPALALPKAYARAGITQNNVDLFEINEAFSCVALANMHILGISHNQINISGGAVALGHPIGSSGCRILVTLVHNLIRTNKNIGAAGICNGGGGASSMILQRA